MTQSDTAPFAIREMTGDKRELVLMGGHVLPFKPFSLDGEQRVNITWNQGSPAGTSNVMGGKLNGTTIKGRWSDTFVADTRGLEYATVGGVRINSVKDLATLVDDMTFKGQKVEVTWLHHIRRGHLGRFIQDWQNTHDLEWSLTFEWTSRGDEDAQIAEARNADLQAIVAGTNDNVVALEGASDSFAGRLEEYSNAFNPILNAIGTANVKMTDTLNNVQQGVIRPQDGIRQAVSLLQSMADDGKDFIEAVYSQPAELAIPKPLGSASVGEVLRAEVDNRQMTSNARKLAHQSARNQQNLLRTIDPDVIRVFYAREGQDLREVSREFYQTSDGWQSIAKFNGLSRSRLSAGQVILVPRVAQ